MEKITEIEAKNVVYFLRSNKETADLHDRKVIGNKTRGEELFKRYCYGCHGGGSEQGIAPPLNQKFKKQIKGWYIQAMMALGRPGTQMLPKMGGDIVEPTPTQVNDVTSYILERE